MGDDGPVSRNVIRVAIAIIERGTDVLICRRKADAILAGLWEFPGGKIAAGESTPEAAVRETREELGIDVDPYASMDPITFDYPHGRVELHPIRCHYTTGDPRAIGCAEWRWAPRHHLSAADFPPANAPILEWLRDAP